MRLLVQALVLVRASVRVPKSIVPSRAPVRVATSIVVVRHAREGSERRRAARRGSTTPCTQGIIYLCGMDVQRLFVWKTKLKALACTLSGMSLSCETCRL